MEQFLGGLQVLLQWQNFLIIPAFNQHAKSRGYPRDFYTLIVYNSANS